MKIINKIRSMIIGKTLEPSLVNITGFSQTLENVELVQNLDNFTSCSNGLYGNANLKRLAITYPMLTNCTSFSGMFSDCSSLIEVPLFDTSSGTSFSGMFSSCTALTSVPLFDTSLGTGFISMFYGCTSLPTVPLFDTSSGTSFYSMFNGCYALSIIPNLDWTNDDGSNYGYYLSGNFTNVLITFGELNVDIHANLDRANLVAVFNNLPVTLLSPYIFLYGNPGTVDLSPTDIEIATNKGWIVVTLDQQD